MPFEVYRYLYYLFMLVCSCLRYVQYQSRGRIKFDVFFWAGLVVVILLAPKSVVYIPFTAYIPSFLIMASAIIVRWKTGNIDLSEKLWVGTYFSMLVVALAYWGI